ncbi:MAG: cyclodeaminase/cyclohydrolase family protein [Oscillospiraceae bacterium]
MEKSSDKSLSDFTAALASAEPTPGGGGACAYAASMAAALGCMVCNLTIGKAKYAAVQDDVKALLEQLEATRKYMISLIDEDAKAFQPLSKYMSLPKDDPKRREHMDSALRVACYIPTEVMYTCGETLGRLSELAEKGVKSAISDVGVAVELCRAALCASQQNIFINASLIEDEVFAMTLRRECELVREQYLPTADAALKKVAERIG